ncbi:MAG: hypothetical protein P8L85_02060 [Rubripirellula sp.]|nr:hypothetical protein [Rubripirellula sp.]
MDKVIHRVFDERDKRVGGLFDASAALSNICGDLWVDLNGIRGLFIFSDELAEGKRPNRIA